MAEKPAALFIDMDGTVTLNTGDVKLWVLNRLMEGYGVGVHALWRKHVLAGADTRTVFDLFKDNVPQDKQDQFLARYPDYQAFDSDYRELFSTKIDQIQIRPSMTELIRESVAAGIPVVIVTNTVELTTRQIFDFHLGEELSSQIKFVCADNVPEGHQKPSPEHYRAAMRIVDVDPSDQAQVSRCIVVEDTRTGVTAAQGAGIQHIFQFRHDNASDWNNASVYTIRNMGKILRDTILNGGFFNSLVSAFWKVVFAENRTDKPREMLDHPQPRPII